MLYLGENKIFSCEPPKPTYHALGDFDAEPKRIMSIYRFNREFFGKTLDQDDLAIFKDGAEKIVGWNLKYDIGQLADILIDTFAKIPYKDEVHLFDADGGKEDKNVDIVKNKQHLVCSVAVAALIADWQRKLEEEKKDFTIREPWSMLNPAAWTEAFKKRYPGHWDCGSIFPAMFACTDTHFAGEFKHIGHYQGGYKIE
jgi:hypothetical protein